MGDTISGPRVSLETLLLCVSARHSVVSAQTPTLCRSPDWYNSHGEYSTTLGVIREVIPAEFGGVPNLRFLEVERTPVLCSLLTLIGPVGP